MFDVQTRTAASRNPTWRRQLAARATATIARAKRIPGNAWRQHQWEIVALAVITALAGLLRFYGLTSLPSGLHGDEAVAGLEAQRILDQGSIGPYSPPAAGQPSGPLYLFAGAVGLFGPTLFAVRLMPALFGTLTVPLLYLVVRRSLGAPTALVSALLLAVMGWHIHFARVGFPLETWPFAVLLAIGAQVEAVRRNSPAWWAAAGGLTSAGIYVYNGHFLVIAIGGVFLLGWLIAHRGAPLLDDVLHVVFFAAVGVLVAIPMLRYAADDANGYFSHFDRDKITATAEWKAEKTPVDQAAYIMGRYRDFWDRLSFDPELDSVDATGITAIVPRLMLVPAVAGMAAALARRRTPLVALGALIVVLMPFGSALTVDGLARRTFAMAPFVAMFGAVALVESVGLVTRLAKASPFAQGARWGAIGLATVLVGAIAYQNIHDYFWKFRDAPLQEWVYVTDFTESVGYIRTHAAGTYVYFLSERWSFNYEPRQFAAGSARGEDRSSEFGALNLALDPTKGKPLFMLVGNYRQLLPQLQQVHPGGEVVVGGEAANPRFIAYWPTVGR